MGVFFETARSTPSGMDATPVGRVGSIKWSSFLVAMALLIVVAGAAIGAEAAKWTTATENLWTAFKTILGIVLGFISGEATGTASK